MKIALCFSGQPRFFDNQEMIEFLRDLNAEDAEVDIYMHLWKPKDPNNFARSPWTNIQADDAKISVDNLEEDLKKIYNPFSIEIEEERILVEDPSIYKRTPSPTSPEFVHRMFYSQWKVGNLLRNSGKTYDMVFRLRTDTAVMGLKKLSELVGDKIWVPDNCPVFGWFNDNFSLSSQENYLKLSETYLNIKEFYDNGYDMNGEPMLKAQAIKEDIYGKITKNRYINVGLYRGGNPPVIQGIWIGEMFQQLVKLNKNQP